ncbi:MAG: extracellular solute-binding protein [Acidimicrobiia bacterium]|nr:extracellular solute-binding protein [Acidimicrobiia bacterium]
MRRVRRKGLALLLSGVVIAACAGGGGSESTSAESSDELAAADSADPFERLVAAAQDEGSVVFYTAEADEVLQAYARGFEDAYGIEVVFQALTQGPMQERLAQEFQAGRVQADVAGNTLDLAWNGGAAEEGHLAELTEAELPNLAAVPDEHKSEHWVINRVLPIGVFYNTDLVDAAELPDTLEALADMTEWKGRVAIPSPELGGSIHEWHYRLLQELGEERYEPFINRLVGDLDAVVSGSVSALAAQVGAGELYALIGLGSTVTVPAINAGAPAAIYYPEPVTVYRSSLQVLVDGPHPNAGKLFVDWLVSEEGARASCGTGVCAPPHIDVEGQIEFPETAESVDGVEARQVGDEYVNGLVQAASN